MSRWNLFMGFLATAVGSAILAGCGGSMPQALLSGATIVFGCLGLANEFCKSKNEVN